MKKTIAITGCILMAVVFFAVWGYMHYQPGYVYTITINAEEMGCVATPEEYSELLTELLVQEQEITGLNLTFADELSANREFQWQPEPDYESVTQLLAERVTFLAAGWAVVIDNQPRFYVDSRETAELVLDEAKNRFVRPGVETLSAEIVEDVNLEEHPVEPELVISPEKAVDLLVQGAETVGQYVVRQGDSLSSISRSANVSQAQLQEANPQLADGVIAGQELNLIKPGPMISVRVTETAHRYESIPYSTVYRNSNKVWFYQQRVAAGGKSGQREITYAVEYVNGKEVSRSEIGRKVVTEPSPRIIERGTSRSPSGSLGAFRWPLKRGHITSLFGMRNHPITGKRALHTGVDIGGGINGAPIYAAASGTVVQSTYHNSYGNMIVVRHSNGYFTLYAHMIRRSPYSVGQKVNTTTPIGHVGSTGDSTGPHLHFEIRRSASVWHQGTPVNPLQFFRP